MKNYNKNSIMQNQNILKESLSLCKQAFAYNFLFSFLINLLTLATSIYSLQVLDRVLSSGSIETLIMLSIIMIIIYVLLAFFQIIRSEIFSKISGWLDIKLSSLLLEASIQFDSDSKGSQNLRDLSTIKSFITSPALTSLFDAPWSIIYFITIFFIHPILGILVVAGAVILFLLALLYEKVTKKETEALNDFNLKSMKYIDSVALNSEVIKAMGMKRDIVRNWQEINDQVVKKSDSTNFRSSLVSSITKSIRLLIQMLTMAIGAYLVIQNKMSAGGIIATSILSGKALAPFDAAVTIYKGLINSKKSYGRLSKNLEFYEINKIDRIKLPKPRGEIAVEQLIYKTANSDNFIVKSVSFNINYGEVIGIIGASGSGKTTLARLLVGVLAKTKGHIRIDGADLSDINEDDLGGYIGYLPQSVELFNASIKENIARMNKNAEDNDIIKAASFAGVHNFILKLPLAYETNAMSLSAGQKQRVALARAFYGNPKIVVLDEPNSNLDNEGDIALISSIINAKKLGITTIIISHKPMILNSVDKIMLMKNGEVALFDDAKKVITILSEQQKSISDK